MTESTYTIPGMEIALEDGNFGQDIATNTGNGILLIGPSDAKDAGYNFTPVAIQSLSVFGGDSKIGSYNIKNALARGYKQLKDTCSNPISAISLPADCIIDKLEDTTRDNDAIKVKAYVYLNELFNIVKENSSYERTVLKNLYGEVYDFEAHVITLDLLKAIGGTKEVVDPKDDTKTIDATDLTALINEYTPEGKTEAIDVNYPEWFYNKWIAVLPGAKNVKEGYLPCVLKSEDTKASNIVEYSFIRFNKTEQTVTVEVVNPKVEAHPFLSLKKKDGSTGMFVSGSQDVEVTGVGSIEDLAAAKSVRFKIDELFAQFCLETTLTNSCMIGYMSVRPPETEELIDVRKWVASQSKQALNGYLQKCATLKVAFFLGNLAYYDTIEAAYAGTDAALPANSSTTNKQIRGLQGMTRYLSASQVSKLSYNNLVTLRNRNGNFFIADGVTTAGADSDFTRLTTVKIANDVIKAVRDVAEPYIGEPNTVEKRNALSDQIEEMLDLLRTDGMIQAFKSQVLATDKDILDGNLQIALSIVPVFELRRINLVIALKPSL